MITYSRKVTLCLRPEWETQLQKLKEEKFHNRTQGEMLRFLIKLGLNAFKAEKIQKSDSE